MRPGVVLGLLLSVLFVGLLLTFAPRKARRSTETQPDPPQKTSIELAPKTRGAPPEVQTRPGRASTPASPEDEVTNYYQQKLADPLLDWKQPINFYGAVLDESEKPVAGASVHFKWNDLSEEGTSTESATSDSTGMFSLVGKTGKRLFVEVTKEGYYTSRRNPLAFEYANPADGLFTPDAAHPVIFHLRKKGETEALVQGLRLLGSRIDGTLSYVDLTEGKSSLKPPGDFAVSFTRSAANASRKFDWTFKLAGVEGGVLESTNEFMFRAPDEGYQPVYEISHRADDADWTSQERHNLFVKSRGGKHYARIEITILPDYQHQAAYDLRWFMNPNGSPNLEFDPEKQIKPPN